MLDVTGVLDRTFGVTFCSITSHLKRDMLRDLYVTIRDVAVHNFLKNVVILSRFCLYWLALSQGFEKVR